MNKDIEKYLSLNLKPRKLDSDLKEEQQMISNKQID